MLERESEDYCPNRPLLCVLVPSLVIKTRLINAITNRVLFKIITKRVNYVAAVLKLTRLTSLL